MDLDEIRDTLDRRESKAVLKALLDETDDILRLEIANVLGWLNDPRLMLPLSDILIDQSNTDSLRIAASATLRDMTNSPEPDHDDLDRLWNSGDLILQRHALGFMTWRHESMFGPILDKPEHPLYLPLLSELRFAFPFPRFSEELVRALNDPRADIRYQAAEALFWNKPVIALQPLINALEDPDLDVQLRVIETLQRYPSRSARTALKKCARQEALRAAATASLTYNDWMFDLDPEKSGSTSEPVPDEKFAYEDNVGRPDWLRSASAFSKRFGELNTCWDGLVSDLWRANWDEVSRFARQDIADFMLACPDVLVREHAAKALASWGDERVSNLLDDRYFAVAKSAGFEVRRLEPSQDIADQLWTMLKSASGVHASELLESFVTLSENADWPSKCVSVALDQYWEEDVRNTAIHCLFDYFLETGQGREKLEEIADLVLTEPPICSWALHNTILERCQEVPAIRLPDFTRLRDIDDRSLETKIAGITR